MVAPIQQVLMMLRPIANPNWANVLFQSDFEGTNNQQTSFLDDTGVWTLSRGSGAGKLSTTQKLFGNTAAFTDSNAQGWQTGQSPLWNLSTANGDAFTWEFGFFQPTALTGCDVHAILTAGGAINTWVRMQGDGNVRYLGSKTGSGFPVDVTTTGGTLAANTWGRVCLEKNTSGTIRIYIGGVMRAKSTPADSVLLSASDLILHIGQSNGNPPQNIYTDTMCITKGLALYDSDAGYTLATGPFPIGP